MSTYTTSYASPVEMNADNTFTILTVAPSNSVATESIDDGVLQTGEAITIDTDINTNPVETTIEGFHDDGYVIFADGGYVFFSNTSYDAGTTLSLETDETDHPGLPVCFTKGTLIDTPDGPKLVESLKAGDTVIGSKRIGRVKWVGWRNYSFQPLRMSEELRQKSVPVRIRRGAIDDNVPSMDLLVSPWHHILIDGALVRANDLVNGHTIIQELDAKQVNYFHIELDQFDVVRAHGVYSESWADGGNRDFFENVDVTTLRPADMQRRLADRPGFTVLRDRASINAIRNSLLKRASCLLNLDIAA